MLKKIFLTLAIIFLPYLIQTNISDNLVKNHYPNAYTWYLSISEKYPDAKLNTIQFCISDHHHVKNNSIYFPLSSIEYIDSWYTSNIKTPEAALLLAQEEYLLLHEAAHVLHYDYKKGDIAIMSAISSCSVSLLHTIKEFLTHETCFKDAMIKNFIAISGITAGLFGYAQFQEKNADTFANQQADKSTLKAGIYWHEQNQKDLNIPEDTIALTKYILEQIHDLAHPTPTQRKESAQKIFEQRFQAL